MLKLFKPFISQESIWNVVQVLKGDQIAEGPQVKLFERELEEKTGLRDIVTLNSGTSALELAYELADIGEGDEVIVPVLTCTATNIPLVRRKAKIVFADIDYDLNINVEDVKRKITERTKLVVFVHFGGNNRGLRELLAICESRGIKLVEDAAQAIGSDYWGKADYTAVSLQAIKTITSGDGGFLVCRNPDDTIRARKLRWFGYDREEKQKNPETDLDLAGYKYHMNDVSAAIGRGNLMHLDKIIEHKKKIGAIYESYGLFYNVWLAGGFINNAKKLQDYMKLHDIEVAQYHYRNDINTIFGGKRQDLPIMNKLEERYFFVPFHYEVTEELAHKIGRLYTEEKLQQ